MCIFTYATDQLSPKDPYLLLLEVQSDYGSKPRDPPMLPRDLFSYVT